MNEVAENASNIPAIILLFAWCAFLSTLELLFRPRESAEAGTKTGKPEAGARLEKEPYPELLRLDPQFEAEAFLEGARRAYEAVLQAYSRHDFDTLRPLLSAEVLAAFSETAATRARRQEVMELTFVGIRSAEIARVEVLARSIEIDVIFHAEVILAERSAAGDILAGDPDRVTVSADLWTFSRPLPLKGKAWIVAATDEAAPPR
jgi:predicted lipid-binding transport protein (Tim44 family)